MTVTTTHPQYEAGYAQAIADLEQFHQASTQQLHEAKHAVDTYAYAYADWADYLRNHRLDTDEEDAEAIELRQAYEAGAGNYRRCYLQLPRAMQREAEAYAIVAIDEISEETCLEIPAIPDPTDRPPSGLLHRRPRRTGGAFAVLRVRGRHEARRGPRRVRRVRTSAASARCLATARWTPHPSTAVPDGPGLEHAAHGRDARTARDDEDVGAAESRRGSVRSSH